jgi:hypothetical protein
VSANDELLAEFDRRVAAGRMTPKPTAKAKVVAGDPIKAFEDAILELLKASQGLSKPQAIARLVDTEPDMVMKALKAQEKLDAAPVAPVIKAAEEPKTAQEQIAAHARDFHLSGRVESMPEGYMLAARLYPELAEDALTESFESNL